jgi:hypothetical protein
MVPQVHWWLLLSRERLPLHHHHGDQQAKHPKRPKPG